MGRSDRCGKVDMTDANKLTEVETRVMRMLWDRGGLSASELVMNLPASERPDHAGALELLRSLVAKGAATRHQSGRTVVYKPKLNKETARSHVLGRLFESAANDDGNADGNVDGGLNIIVLRESDVSPQDWADLQAERAEKARRRRDG